MTQASSYLAWLPACAGISFSWHAADVRNVSCMQACKENRRISSQPVDRPTCCENVTIDGIGPGFMRLAMGLVLPLNLDTTQDCSSQVRSTHTKLSEHERQANARRLLDEELAKRLQLAVTAEKQCACTYQVNSSEDGAATTTTHSPGMSTSPSDEANAGFNISRESRMHSCGSYHLQ